MVTRVVTIKLPEYTIKKKPNYTKLGKKVDAIIEKNFPDGKYIMRALGSQDHALTLNQLTQIILKKGTDKYDPKRKDVCHEQFSGYDYDIQAGTITIKNGKLTIPKNYKYKTEFGDTIWHFYEHTLHDRGYPVRIDLLLIYDPAELTKARKRHPTALSTRKGLNQYLYKFKNKKKALLGIIKILK